MKRPCAQCEVELHADELDAGRRCARCEVLILDDALRVLLAGIPVQRRFRLHKSAS